jgi:nucleoside-diphosphate-sugar epimerase
MCAESDKAYGSGPIPYSEDQALMPGSVYEASKACVSHVAAAYYHNYGLPVFTVRSANVYGPEDENMTRLIPNTIVRLLRGEKPLITAGAEGFVRELFYVDDFVDAVTALMNKQPWGEVFNVGSGESATIADIVTMICKLMGKSQEAEVWDRPSDLAEISTQILCLDKLDSWVPTRTCIPLNNGLQRTIKWHTNKRK